MYNMQLWETSGHAANYKENMFLFEVRFVCYTSLIFFFFFFDQVWIISNREAKTSGAKRKKID
jgi:hypothetical protein